MTEEEAKTKWCPFARQVALISSDYGTGATANRDAQSHYGVDNVNCLGSACMAWRVTHVETKEFQYTDQEGSVLKNREHGFCGLAGTSL